LINIRLVTLISGFILLLTSSTFAAQEITNKTSEVVESKSINTVPFQRSIPKQRFTYEVYYKGISIGEMKQEYRWEGQNVAVNSAADFSFMLFSFGGSQQSDLYWDPQKKLFFTQLFRRESIGFSTVQMTAKFDQAGQKTEIVNNGKYDKFNNEEGQTVDFNAINLQISEGLKNGQTHFEFYMQTSDDIAHYYFELKGKEKIKTELGEFEAYRVQQTRKKDRTFIAWFAPAFDHQMVKFEYERKVLDIEGELTSYSTDF